MTRSNYTHLQAITSVLFISSLGIGCSSQAKPPIMADAAGTTSDGRLAQRSVDLTPAKGGATGSCALQTIYFDTDTDQLSQQARDAISTAVQCYTHGDMPARLILTGATDPRGTEEYNLALGERRARSVERFLAQMGVADERISVHSVGEENASGVDESSWHSDRHVVATAE